MNWKISPGRRAFIVINDIILILTAFSCLLPLVNVLAVSLSANSAVTAGKVTLWPVNLTIQSYKFILENQEFSTSFLITLERLVLGVSINMFIITLTAYPLSKDSRRFKYGKYFTWFFVFTMLFGGGLIPYYMMVKATGLIDTIWALVIPCAMPVYSMIMLLNFFRNLPKELEEAAFIDGASHFVTLWKIYVPLSLPAIATLTLFSMVSHWNAWFDGLIFMNNTTKYPLQTYLETIFVNQISLTSKRSLKDFAEISDRTTKAAQIFVATVPILCVYPFLQKYFVKGIVLGSVKG